MDKFQHLRTLMAIRKLVSRFALAACLFSRVETYSQSTSSVSTRELLGKSFSAFVADMKAMKSDDDRFHALQTLATKVQQHGHLLTEDSSAIFFYIGKAGTVSVPSDLNSWNPAEDVMTRVPGTDFFFLMKTVDRAARFEYKLRVDSVWMLDPSHGQRTAGGFGTNSEVWMPGYRPPRDIEEREDIPHGRIDSLIFPSTVLGRSHPVLMYLPPSYSSRDSSLPTIFVTDGGEYLSLARMHNVMDNLIADGRIPPVIGVFIDPRTDPRDHLTNTRGTDYVLSDTFVRFLTDELRPELLRRYRIATSPERTAILGASLGGLISTYVAFMRPDVFGLCAAQSPAYQIPHDSIFTILERSERKPFRIYLGTGTIHDAQRQARQMRAVLASKGYPFRYEEFPEAHNWANWRARLADILVYFWGTP